MKLRYAVVYEQTPSNYGAYVPDLPGCISTGANWREIQANIREAMQFHIEGLQEYGDPVPEPRMSIGDAMTFHRGVLSEHGRAAPQLETTAAKVEIEVTPARAAGVAPN